MIFDLDNILPHFAEIPRSQYLGEPLQNASTPELREFKKVVKIHQKNSKFIPDLRYMPNMSAHDTIITAINHALFKRSKWYPFYKFILPMRTRLVSWFSGVDIQEHPYCGTLYVKRQNRKTFLHLTHTKLFAIIGKFLLKNWQYLITTVIALAVLYTLLK